MNAEALEHPHCWICALLGTFPVSGRPAPSICCAACWQFAARASKPMGILISILLWFRPLSVGIMRVYFTFSNVLHCSRGRGGRPIDGRISRSTGHLFKSFVPAAVFAQQSSPSVAAVFADAMAAPCLQMVIRGALYLIGPCLW